MSPGRTALPRAVVVDRLRGAGCVFAEDEADLLIASAGTSAELAAMVQRRVGGLPLEHVVGWAEFCGMRVAVDPGVFVPRRRTELLVAEATALARPGAVVVDLCCGSAAVALAVASALPDIDLYAADIEPAAVACARTNMSGVGGQVFEGDLFEALPTGLRGRIDILAANVPYVPTDAVALMPPEARLFEPRIALDGGSDGLDVLRRVAAEASRWLAPGGHLLSETSARQTQLALETFTGGGLDARSVTSDDLDAQVVIGTNPQPQEP